MCVLFIISEIYLSFFYTILRYNMYQSDNKIDSDELYQKEREKLISEINKKSQKMLKKLKDQSKPEVGSV